MFQKVTVLAVLIALIVAAFPTGVLAAGDLQAGKIEKQWDRYVNNVEKMAAVHGKIDARAKDFLAKKKHSQFKTQIANHLNVYHSNLDAANTIINTHDGFDHNGKVVDTAVANQTLKALGLRVSILRPAWHQLMDMEKHFPHK